MKKLAIIILLLSPLFTYSQDHGFMNLKILTKDSLTVRPNKTHGYKLNIYNVRDSNYQVKDSRYVYKKMNAFAKNIEDHYYTLSLGFSAPEFLVTIIHETDTMSVTILSGIPFDSRVDIPFISGEFVLDLVSLREKNCLRFDPKLKKNRYSYHSDNKSVSCYYLSTANWSEHKKDVFKSETKNWIQNWRYSYDLIFRIVTHDGSPKKNMTHFFSEAPEFEDHEYDFNITLNDTTILLKNNRRMPVDSTTNIYSPRYIAVDTNFIMLSTKAGTNLKHQGFFQSLKIDVMHNSDIMTIILYNRENISVSRSLIMDSVEFRPGTYEFDIKDILIQRYGGSFIDTEQRKDKTKLVFYSERNPFPPGAGYDITPFK